MDEYTREVFAEDHPDIPFPWYEEIGEPQVSKIRQGLATALRAPHMSGEALMRHIGSHCVHIPELNARNRHFRLDALLKKHTIPLPEFIYLNYSVFESVDRMSFRDAAQYFSSLWLPASDDVDIFDDTFNWVVFIDHDGYVHMLQHE